MFRRTGQLAAACIGIVAANAASALSGHMQGNVYVSPGSDISCKVANYDLGEVRVKDRFDKFAGTITFLDFFNITRVDFERFGETDDMSSYSASQLEHGYATYFDSALVPLVRSGIKDASVVYQRFDSDTKPIYISVMRLPLKGGDSVRGAIEYTDGQAMYVVSVTHPMRPELGLTLEREIDDVINDTRKAFESCQLQAHGL
jgi:hypothetical protein